MKGCLLLKTTFKNLETTDKVKVLANKSLSKGTMFIKNWKELEAMMELNNLVDKYAFFM